MNIPEKDSIRPLEKTSEMIIVYSGGSEKLDGINTTILYKTKEIVSVITTILHDYLDLKSKL